MDVKKKIKVALSVIGAILIAVLGLILFWRLSKSTKGKPVASKTQSNMPQTVVVEKVTVASGETTIKPPRRPLHSSGRPTESTEENEVEVNLPNNINIEPLQRKPEHQPVTAESPQKTVKSTAQPSPLPPSSPETEAKTLPNQKDWKAEFETALAKFIRNPDASDIPSLEEALKKMLEEQKEPQQALKEYLKKNYESKRDAALGAKVAGEKDLIELRLLLTGLRTADPSYPDEEIEVQFANKFVSPFLNPFKALESDATVPEAANLAVEAKKAFPLAKLFASLLPQTTAKQVKDQLCHDSFNHKNLVAFLEHKIPKLIEEANDAASEATAKNHIAILRLLNPKSRFAFEGEESFDACRKALRPFVFHVPPPPNPNDYPPSNVALLDFAAVKDMSISQLEELQNQFAEEQMNYYREDTPECKNCAYNIALLDMLLYKVPDWDANIFNEWKNTGFRTVDCPEFIKWLRGVYSSHRYDGGKFLEQVAEVLMRERSVYNKYDETAHVQYCMALLACEYLGMGTGNAPFIIPLSQFLEAGTVEHAKVFFNSVMRLDNRYKYTADSISKTLSKMWLSSLSSEITFSCNMLYFWNKQHLYQTKTHLPKFHAQLKALEESGNPEYAYHLWTECARENSSYSCSNTLLNVQFQYKNEQELENLELEYKCFKKGKPEKIVANQPKGQFLLLNALQAYIEMRQYYDNNISANLESMAISVFGISQMPSDRKSLTVQTYKKNPELHNELAKYLLFSSFKKEWNCYKVIMDSLAEYKKFKDEAGNKEKVLSALISLIEACKKGTDCKIDTTSKEFSCTTEEGNSMLELLSKLEGKLKTYCQGLLSEGMKLNDLAKFIVYLKDEMDLVKSSMSEFLNPSIKI